MGLIEIVAMRKQGDFPYMGEGYLVVGIIIQSRMPRLGKGEVKVKLLILYK